MSKLILFWNFIRRHKYAITLIAFALIIGVLDEENSLLQRFSHWREINRLNTEIEHYRNQYERDSKRLKEISSDLDMLEKVAREKYLMKKPNEDIYVFEEDLNKED